MRTIVFILGVVIASVFVSCDKGDMEVKKLSRGEGIWSIETLRTDYYDAAGASVDSTTTAVDLGEFVFFQNTTLNGLYDEHLVVVNIDDTSGVIYAYPGGVYYDDERVKIDAPGSGLSGVWTVADNGRNKQEWHLFSVNANGGLSTKYTLNIKKK